VIEEIEFEDLEVSLFTFGSPDNLVSIFLVTSSSMSDGEAPGYVVMTTAIGIFTSGLDSIGSLMNE
jgi:hypothetical protein